MRQCLRSPPSTIFRLENGQQSITLNKLQGVLRRLKASPADVFAG
jgi:hypothetical protein